MAAGAGIKCRPELSAWMAGDEGSRWLMPSVGSELKAQRVGDEPVGGHEVAVDKLRLRTGGECMGAGQDGGVEMLSEFNEHPCSGQRQAVEVGQAAIGWVKHLWDLCEKVQRFVVVGKKAVEPVWEVR